MAADLFNEIQFIVREATCRFLIATRVSKNVSLEEAFKILRLSSVDELRDYESGRTPVSPEQLTQLVSLYQIPEPNETLQVFMLSLESKIEDHQNRICPLKH